MIIFSITRTREVKIGFLGRADRENVAMSRAMDVVFIVGDLRLLEKANDRHPHWCQTVQALRNHSPQERAKFQIDIEGTVAKWFVDDKEVDLTQIPVPLTETLEDPLALADAEGLVEQIDCSAYMPEEVKITNKDRAHDESAEANVVKTDTVTDIRLEARAKHFKELQDRLMDASNLRVDRQVEAVWLRDGLVTIMKNEKAGQKESGAIKDIMTLARTEMELPETVDEKVVEYVIAKAVIEGLNEKD